MFRFPFRAFAVAAAMTFAAAGTVRAEQGQHVDIVICLDVSGSMEGLVNQAYCRGGQAPVS